MSLLESAIRMEDREEILLLKAQLLAEQERVKELNDRIQKALDQWEIDLRFVTGAGKDMTAYDSGCKRALENCRFDIRKALSPPPVVGPRQN